MNKCLKTLSVAAVTVGVMSAGVAWGLESPAGNSSTGAAPNSDAAIYNTVKIYLSTPWNSNDDYSQISYIGVIVQSKLGGVCATNLASKQETLPASLQSGGFSKKYINNEQQDSYNIQKIPGYTCGVPVNITKMIFGAYMWECDANKNCQYNLKSQVTLNPGSGTTNVIPLNDPTQTGKYRLILSVDQSGSPSGPISVSSMSVAAP